MAVPGAKFTGVSLSVANAVNEALKEVHDRFGELPISEVRARPRDYKKHLQGAYNDSGVLLVKGRPDTWAREAEKNFRSGWNASGEKYGVLYHEFGHATWRKISPSQRSAIDQIYRRERHQAYKNWLADGGARSGKSQAEYFGRVLSQYAHTDTQEFFAEAFSQIMSRKMRPVSREVLQIIAKNNGAPGGRGKV